MLQTYYNLRNENVVYEKINGQMILADLEHGTYCTLQDDNSILIFEAFVAGYSIEKISDELVAIKNDRESVQTLLSDFIDFFINSNLFKKQEADNLEAPKESIQWSGFNPGATTQVLRIFDDMETILTLDPVEIDEQQTV